VRRQESASHSGWMTSVRHVGPSETGRIAASFAGPSVHERVYDPRLPRASIEYIVKSPFDQRSSCDND
jgi:hypothetical protein